MTFARRHRRYRFCAAVAIGAMAVMTPAQGQGGPRQTFSIQTSDLGEALKSVSRQSGREIMFTAEAVKGKTTAPLSGTFTPDEAVRTLLAGSGLSADYRKDVILIRGRSEAPGALSGDPEFDQDILITGTRIRGAAPASPVVSAKRESIQAAGQNNLGEYVRSLTQNYGGGQNPGVSSSQGARNQNLNNSSALNLRGLGADATLTLINGHRVAYDGVAQGVDISAIPVAALERVEIVADGASALYGSDAVGGVANVILRRDFDGLTTSARYGASTDGGNSQQQYGAVTGSRWASGGFMVAVDYNRTSEISARHRFYTRNLDDSATLVPGQKQISVVLAGHQRLSDTIRLEIDGQFNDRRLVNALPSLATASVFTTGNYAEPKLSSYSVTPTLRVSLPAGWETSLSGTIGKSKSDVASSIYSQNILTTRTQLLYDNDFNGAEATAEGPLVKIAGGDIRFAAGAGYRSATLHVKTDRTPTGGVTTTTENVTGSRDVIFGYGELSVPLVSHANAMPLIDALRLSGAVRYERYKGIAGVASPKFGLIYKPIEDVTISASWGKSFKAPTLFQSYQSRVGNIVLGSVFPGIPTNLGVLYLTGGNSSLKPEYATTWTTSLKLEPRFAKGLRIEGSFFDISFRDRVAQPLTNALNAFNDPTAGSLAIRNPTNAQIAAAVARLPQGAQNFTGLPDASVVIGGIVDNTIQNAARQTIRGFDLAVDYQAKLNANDTLQLTGSLTYQESDQQLAEGKPVVQLSGLIFNPPDWRGRIGGTFRHANAGLSLFANYIGGTLDNRLQPNLRVGAFTSLDAVVRIRAADESGLFRGLEATVGLMNMFNERPDTIRNTNAALPPYDSANYSVAGRVISLTVLKSW